MSRIREFYASQEGKAFPYRVELTDAGGPLYSGSQPASYNDYNGFTSSAVPRYQTPLSQREAALHMQTYGGGQSIDWLIDAVNFTVNAIGSVDYHFSDGTDDFAVVKKSTDPAETKVAPPDLIKLFAEPNPHMGWVDLCELSLIDFLLVGNAYWVKWAMDANGKPLALYRMAPQFVKIIPGQFGPEKYVYRLPGAPQDITFTPDQVVHFKRPNPNDPYYGLGIVKGGSRALDMELALSDTMASYYEKAAIPSGVVSTDRRVPRDVFSKLKSQLRSFYSGGRQAGQLMVLEAGLHYQGISPNAQQAMFSTMGSWSRDRILAMFNINKRLIGVSDDQSLGTGEIAQWQSIFDQKTAIPLSKRFAGAISRGLTQPGWGLDVCLDYTETQQPDQVLKNAQTTAALPGVKVREVRQVAGLPPTGDPDIDDFVLNMPGPNMDAAGQGGTADRNLLGEPGRPPISNNVPGFGVAKGSAPPAAKPPKAGRVANTKALDGDFDVLDAEQLFGTPMPTHPYYVGYRPQRAESKAVPAIEDSLAALDALAMRLPASDEKAMQPANVHVGEIANVRPGADLLADQRLSGLDAIAASMQRELASAAHTLERGLLDAAEGKAEGTLYQRVKNAAAWQAFKDRVQTILEDYVTQAMSLANVHHAAQGLSPSSTDYTDAVDSVVNRPEGLSGIFDTLKASLMSRILTAQQKSAAKNDVDGIIREAINEWQSGKAQVVALTEATHAYNVGTLDLAEANGHSDVLVSDGEDSDEPCVAANGQTWSIEKARSNVLEHPNCRRAFVPLAAVA